MLIKPTLIKSVYYDLVCIKRKIKNPGPLQCLPSPRIQSPPNSTKDWLEIKINRRKMPIPPHPQESACQVLVVSRYVQYSSKLILFSSTTEFEFV